MTSEDKTPFSLKGASGGKFTDVFGCLDTIEAKHNAEEKVRYSGGEKQSSYWKKMECMDDVIDLRKNSRKNSNDGPGERSGDSKEPHAEKGSQYQARFRKPRVPSQKFSTPGFKLAPDKWKCYSLSDVDNSQMSERANTSAALSFLSDLKKQHGNQATDETTELGKVVFKKPKLSKTEDGPNSFKADKKQTDQVGASFGGKLVMPEYSFGTKRNKDTPKTVKKGDEVKGGDGERVSLGHLNEESDECEEEAVDMSGEGRMSSVTGEQHQFKNKGKRKRTIRGKEEEDGDEIGD